MGGLTVSNDGKTTIFTINRPDAKNAINSEVANEMMAKFAEFDASDQRVAIITAEGDYFSCGADLKDLPILWKAFPSLGITTEKPVISAVTGDCIGAAFMMTVLSDLCVASENAVFHYPEAKFGVTGGVAATLAARIPHKIAMDILLMCTPISAQRAYEVGFVNRVVPQGQALAAALEMAREMETMAPLVLKTLKRFVIDTLPVSPSELRARADRDLEVIRASEDRVAGVKALYDGTIPTFYGR